MFRKTLSLYLLLYLLLPVVFPIRPAHAQDTEPQSLAVLNLDAKGISLVEAEIISDRLRSYVSQLMISSRYRENENAVQYTIIERTQMDKIFDQYDIQNTGCVADSCMVEYGKMLQANRILVGTIGHLGQTYSVSIRILNVETSETIATANRQHRGTIDDLVDTVVVEIVDELLLGEKKKSKMMWYLLVGVIAAAGAGVAMMGGSDGGGGTVSTSLPMPPDMP